MRLKYAGVDPARIAIEGSLPARSRGRSRTAPSGEHAPLYALPTYTAMLALRKLLGKRGEHLRSAA